MVAAMDHIELNSCLRFVDYDSTVHGSARVVVERPAVSTGACYVVGDPGYNGWDKRVVMGDGCYVSRK